MIKTLDELKEQAEKIKLTYYRVHDCSICNYPCGYIIEGENVSYDSGCDCVAYSNVQLRNWEDLTRTYNMNQPENNPEVSKKFLDKLNATWKFDNDK